MLILIFCLTVGAAHAQTPRVLPPGTLPGDSRLGKLKDLDGYFPFTPSKSPEEWAKRAERVRRQVLVANGLWPMPTKTPLEPVVHGKLDRGDYTVEKVYFQSYPGHFVTGSLYRPKNKPGKLPGVLCPHGHWPNGRFTETAPAELKRQISEGAERFESGGRSPLQARCVQLARMGCVVFHYDMLGYADSLQLSFELVHRFSKQRPQMESRDNWGFFSTQAELRQQSVMGVQTYNSVRALDWICSLSDVDPERIAVTGASGGGTQTFVLCAIDPRPAVAFPAVMVSTAMQGGCTCENCSLLRVGTGNIELAALMAPRPLGMSGANDWTKELESKGLPQLKAHYAMLGVPDRVLGKVMLQFPHNYNYVSREVMYQWFNKHLKLGLAEPVLEEDYKPLSAAELTVWDSEHPRPTGGDDYERSLIKTITADSDRQLAALTPTDAASLGKYRQVVGGAMDVIIGRDLPPAGAVEQQKVAEHDRGEFIEFHSLLKNKAEGEELPAVFLYPKKWNRTVVLWIHEAGKAGLFAADGSPNPEALRILKSGAAVVGVDLLYQGEFLADGKPLAAARHVENPREFAGYTFGYNPSLFAQRVHDVLSLISFCRNFEHNKPERLYLLGIGGAGPWVAAAVGRSGAVDRAAIDTAGFRFASLKSYLDPNFVPGIVKYGDLPALLALCAPAEIWVTGEGAELPKLVQAAYAAAGQPASAVAFAGRDVDKTSRMIDWLLR